MTFINVTSVRYKKYYRTLHRSRLILLTVKQFTMQSVLAFISLYFLLFGFSYFDVDLSTFYLKESEVIIEEVHDDDTFEYANMPPLVTLPSPLFLSHTDPPFLYQYVGDQVKIIQVLGNYPSISSSNLETNNSDNRDQKENSLNESFVKTLAAGKDNNTDISENVSIDNKKNDEYLMTDIPNKGLVKNVCIENKLHILHNEKILPESEKVNDEIDMEKKIKCSIVQTDQFIDCSTDINISEGNLTSPCVLDIPINNDEDNDASESDDEASFGTPDGSPKGKRKMSKGKYGKPKAPPPPHTKKSSNNKLDIKVTNNTESSTSQENLLDIMKHFSQSSFKESELFKANHIINPIAENKRRHKSKSPCRTPKSNSSSIGKLLHLPTKLAFWHKTDEKPKTGSISTSSDDCSRRSSTVENTFDEFQSCTDLNVLVSKNPEKIPNVVVNADRSFMKDEPDTNGNISLDVFNKSDALQKLIDAKLESHPEYKNVSLHEEIPTTSKSTDV